MKKKYKISKYNGTFMEVLLTNLILATAGGGSKDFITFHAVFKIHGISKTRIFSTKFG